MNKILLVVFMIILSVSCATKITDMSIFRTKVSIYDMNGNRIEAMLPDSVYNIDIRVTDTDGIEYQNPNYRNFSIDLLRKLDIETQAFFNLSLETALETFHPLGTKAYGLSISVKDNPYPSMKYEYPLDWANYNTLAFRGINGKKGEDGDPGFPASGEDAENVTGGSGKDGTDGTNGYAGKDTELLILKYQYGDSEKLLLYDMNREKLFLTNIKTITIDTSGGNGGNGGNGGSGGELILLSSNSSIFNNLNPVASGGEGGNPGRSGKSYNDVLSTIYRGDRGRAGRDGRDGKVQFMILGNDEINRILDGIDEEGFEKSDVIF